jgi:hypothetical protein
VTPAQRTALSAHVDAERLRRLETSRALSKKVNRAATAIGLLSLLFVIGGLLMAALTRTQAAETLSQLEGRSPDAVLDIGGEQMTVAEVRDQLKAAPKQIFIVNLALGAIMLALYFWAQSAPLPAVLVATCVYVMVQVVGAVLDPTSLTKGIIIKVLAIVVLFSGIRAALEQRNLRRPTRSR